RPSSSVSSARRCGYETVRTAIDMDKNRVFAQRLRQSVQTYFDDPWALTYANADRLLDMRGDGMSLRDGGGPGGWTPQRD
ncbi:hypothetical protein C9F09_18485, partial [Salmonella enterica subsp. enterica serovar Wilhelmsburg]